MSENKGLKSRSEMNAALHAYVEKQESRSEDGLFYLQHFLNDIAEADAKWFARITEDEKSRSDIVTAKNDQSEVGLPI